VRAAAQFAAEARHGNHAHLVAVLLAEQRHGAGGDGLVERHDVGLHRCFLRRICWFGQPLDFLDSARSMAA
jgi:hypothetical protein